MAKVALFLAIILTFWKYSNQSQLKKFIPILEKGTIRLYCDEEHSLDNLDNFEKFQETKYIKTLILETCPPPSNGSYANVFRTLNVDVDGIRALKLVNLPKTETNTNYDGPDPRRPQSYHFSDLHIKELQIINQEGIALPIDLKFLEDLANLTSLTIENCDIWGAFPNTTKLERVELSGGTLYGDIGACQGFKVLHLTDLFIFGRKDEYRYKFLKDCKQLVELKLERMDREVCKQHLLQSLSKTVRNITVRHCRLDDFPYSFALFLEPYSFEGYDENILNHIVTHLDVSHNNLESAGFLSTYKALETLDISHNDLTRGMYYLPSLIDLKLDHNNLENYCNSNTYSRARPEDDFLKQLPLKQLSAANTGMRALCFDGMKLSHLELLNLTHNNIAVLDYRQLYDVPGDNFEVDLRHNPLQRVELSQADYEALKRNDSSVARWRKIKVVTNARFPCNCTNAWFTRAVSERLLTIDGATCDDGSPLHLPRISYGLQGCAAACEGIAGCSAANTVHNIMKVKDEIKTIFTEQNSLWWIFSQAYDKFVKTT